MKERDYILATNIARLYAIGDLARALAPIDGVTEADIAEVLTVIGRMRDAVEAEIERDDVPDEEE